jgi:small subunit ribosomal protein S21
LFNFAPLKKNELKISMTKIKVSIKENESIDRALKRFKKKLEKSGVFKEYRSRQFFVKPSVERRNEVGRAQFRQQMQQKEI